MAKTMDMTQGEPRKLMITFAVPMLISSLFQQLYSMVEWAMAWGFMRWPLLAPRDRSHTLLSAF